jgi:hypothetical protein
MERLRKIQYQVKLQVYLEYFRFGFSWDLFIFRVCWF